MAKKKTAKKPAKKNAIPYNLERLQKVIEEVCEIEFASTPLLKALEKLNLDCHRSALRKICGELDEPPETLPTNLLLYLRLNGIDSLFIYDLSDEMLIDTPGIDPDDLAYLIEYSKRPVGERKLKVREMAEILEDDERLADVLENAARAGKKT